MKLISRQLSVLRLLRKLVVPRQLVIIREFGVSEAPIYGPGPKFPVRVPCVTKLVVTTMDGPDAPAYEATDVTVILLPATLKLLWKLAEMVIGLRMAPLALHVGKALMNPVPDLDSPT